MNRTTRQVLAVMVVTTALCADHVAAAAPGRATPAATRDPVAPVVQLAGRLVHRLSQSFCRVVPKVLPGQDRQPQRALAHGPARSDDQSLDVARPPLSPFQFRLPPPTV